MRANDWMDTYLIPVVQKPANFKHTLDHHLENGMTP